MITPVNLYSKLSNSEEKKAFEWLNEIREEDVKNILAVVRTLQCSFDDFISMHSQKETPPFLSLYLIGGNLTEQGERPDIDLLTATNMWYPGGNPRTTDYKYSGVDLVVSRILGLKGYFKEIKQLGELPDDYNIGITKGKVLFELHPGELGGRKIDLSYVRSRGNPRLRNFFNGECGFHSEQEFEKKDVDDSGKSLGKMILYRASPQIFLL